MEGGKEEAGREGGRGQRERRGYREREERGTEQLVDLELLVRVNEREDNILVGSVEHYL